MSAAETFRIAVIGAGPSGVYAADALTKQDDVSLTVDVLDRLPTPYGLVRYGVAPDHHSIKRTQTTFQQVLERPGVRFLGGIDLGGDVTREDLLRHYDAVIYATGASIDRRLEIPGEDLPGMGSATAFVSWYSGHPDARQPFDLDAEGVAVVGVGNVAVDVVRIIAKRPEDLLDTDLPEHVLDVLRASKVRDIYLLGRRGPEHAKFTTKELRELGELPAAEALVHPNDLAHLTEDQDYDKLTRSNLKVLRSWAAEEPCGDKERCLHVRFWCRPVEAVGAERVEGLIVERTTLDPEGRVVGTGEVETLPVQLVLRAVGYRSVPIPGVPFDDRSGVVRHVGGRVVDDAGATVPQEYVAGWLKRGPTGVIGTNKGDAAETARAVLEDLAAPAPARAQSADPIDAFLAERGISVVSYEGWLRIDAGEMARGSAVSRPRIKVTEWSELRELARGGAE